MIDTDLLVAFLLMALLFIRQIYIVKQPNKINYAPLMVGIGAISSVVHFILHPEVTDMVILLKESSFPLLMSLLLYIVMNILNQTQQSQHSRAQEEFSKVLISQVTQMKEYMSELESRMIKNQEEDRRAQEDIREQFVEDIKALDAIQTNQVRFLGMFEEMKDWNKSVSDALEYFTNVQLPDLDNVVHKHIDILRIAEQDHHNQVKTILANAIESRTDISEDIEDLKQNLQSMKNISEAIAESITQHTIKHLSGATDDVAKQIVSLKAHSEGVKTSLLEGENTIGAIREQSEMVMKQMVLSSKKMNEIESQNDGLHDVYSIIKELINDMEVIKADYVKSQSQLSVISRELKNAEEEQIATMKV